MNEVYLVWFMPADVNSRQLIGVFATLDAAVSYVHISTDSFDGWVGGGVRWENDYGAEWSIQKKRVQP